MCVFQFKNITPVKLSSKVNSLGNLGSAMVTSTTFELKDRAVFAYFVSLFFFSFLFYKIPELTTDEIGRNEV